MDIPVVLAIHRLNEYSDTTSNHNFKIELRRMHRNLGRESQQAQGINKELLRKMLRTTENSLKGKRDSPHANNLR